MKHQNVMITLATVSTLLLTAPGAQALSEEATKYQRWQLNRLLDPSQKQLEQEEKGRVFIYDGLRDRDVDRVMREAFDRVDSMMFVETIVTDKQGKPKKDEETGELVVEDDGC